MFNKEVRNALRVQWPKGSPDGEIIHVLCDDLDTAEQRHEETIEKLRLSEKLHAETQEQYRRSSESPLLSALARVKELEGEDPSIACGTFTEAAQNYKRPRAIMNRHLRERMVEHVMHGLATTIDLNERMTPQLDLGLHSTEQIVARCAKRLAGAALAMLDTWEEELSQPKPE